MIETLGIFLQFLLFILVSYFPINKFTFPKIFNSLNNSNLNSFCVNLVIFFTTLLIFSFTRIRLESIFLSIILIYTLIFFYNYSLILAEIFSKKNIELKIFFVCINLFLFFNTAYNLEIGWDGIATWLPKTNNFYNNKNYFDLFYQNINFKNYPHLGSYIWAFFWKNSLLQKEYLGRLFYNYIYITSIFVLANNLKIISDYKKIILIFIIFVFSFDYDNTLQGYQEYVIFSLLIFCGQLFIININKKNLYSYSLFYFFILSAILLPWIKNEGIFYSIFLSIMFYTTNVCLRKKILFITIILINILIQYLMIKFLFSQENIFNVPINVKNIFYNFTNYYELLLKLYYITIYLIHGCSKYPLALLNIFIILIAIKNQKYLKDSKYFFTFLFCNIVFIYSIYIITSADLVWHLQTSIRRLTLQTSGLYSFLIVEILNKKLIKLT